MTPLSAEALDERGNLSPLELIWSPLAEVRAGNPERDGYSFCFTDQGEALVASLATRANAATVREQAWRITELEGALRPFAFLASREEALDVLPSTHGFELTWEFDEEAEVDVGGRFKAVITAGQLRAAIAALNQEAGSAPVEG